MKYIKAPIDSIRLARKRRQLIFKRQMLRIKKAMAQESLETKEMLAIYRKYTLKQATKAEIKIANQQFFDIVKGVGMGVFAILPFAPITIPIMIKLGKWAGVDILPSAFYEEVEDESNKEKNDKSKQGDLEEQNKKE